MARVGLHVDRCRPGAGAVLLLAALMLAGLAPTAGGATYTDASGHYRFDYPDGWTLHPIAGVDASIVGPSVGGFGANIVAQHGAEPRAAESVGWLLSYARGSAQAVIADLNATEVQGARTFTAGRGRLAADYVFERLEGGVALRQRQVLFVSAPFKEVYVLTFTDKASTYDSHEANWSAAVNSFEVVGEPLAAPDPAPFPVGLVVLAGGAAALVASILAALWIVLWAPRKRKARAAIAAAGARAGGSSSAALAPPQAHEAPPSTWPGPSGSMAGLVANGPLPAAWLPPLPAAPSGLPPQPPPGRAAAAAVSSSRSPPAPAFSTAAAIAGPARLGSGRVRCPRCRQMFAVARERPLSIRCPGCGAVGRLG